MKNKDKSTFMFYNVENLFDTIDDPFFDDDEYTPLSRKEWTQKRYFKKIDDLAKVIYNVDRNLPSIIGLAEIENADVLTDLLYSDTLKEGNYRFIHQDSPDNRGIDVALVYKENEYQPIENEFIHVRFPFDEDDTTRDILYTKGLFKGEEVHFYVNHWSSRRDGQLYTEPKRVHLAKMIALHSKRVLEQNPDAKIMFMGDFNDTPLDKSLKQYLKAGNDIDFNDYNFFNLGYKNEVTGKGSLNYRGDWLMFDQMIVSKGFIKGKGLFLRPTDFNVLWKRWLMYKHPRFKQWKPNKTYSGHRYHGGYSDHLPIFVELNFR